MVAILGVFAAFVVIRGRARTRKSVYSSLRSDREVRIRAARERALASQPATPAVTSAAAATPIEAPSRPAWDVSPTSPAPAAAPAAPQFAAQAAVNPPQADPLTPVAPPPPLAAPVAAEPLPAPPPPAVPIAPEPVTAQAPVAIAAKGPGWQAVPQEDKRHIRGQRAATEDGTGGESLTHQILSYAGLVAALLAFLLGVVLMVASSR